MFDAAFHKQRQMINAPGPGTVCDVIFRVIFSSYLFNIHIAETMPSITFKWSRFGNYIYFSCVQPPFSLSRILCMASGGAHICLRKIGEKKTKRKRTIDWPVRKHKNGSDETYAFCRYSCWYENEIGAELDTLPFTTTMPQLATSSLSFFLPLVDNFSFEIGYVAIAMH